MTSLSSDSVITDVTIVASLTFVPPSFTVITHTFGGSEDANLNRDRLLSKKYRYLCYRREKIGECNGTTPVLVALTLVGEGSTVPAGHKPIMNAYGTGERAFKKKLLCAKYAPLGSAGSVVHELIIRSRSQHQLTGYSTVGEINSLLIMYNMAPVSKSDTSFSILDPPSVISKGSGSSSPQLRSSGKLLNTAMGGDHASTPLLKPRGPVHPLTGVPFELNKKYFREDSADADNFLGSIPVKTAEQIENEYQYRFAVERSILS